MFGISVLQDTLRAEQFLIVFTIKLDFLILVRLTHEHTTVLGVTRFARKRDGERRKS